MIAWVENVMTAVGLSYGRSLVRMVKMTHLTEGGLTVKTVVN